MESPLNRRTAISAGVGLALLASRISPGGSPIAAADEPAADEPVAAGPSTGDPAATETDRSAANAGSIGSTILPDPTVEVWRFGIELFTPVTCSDVLATLVIPKAWPEQLVETIDQNIDRAAQVELRDAVNDCAQQAIVTMRRVTAGATINVTADMRITRHSLGPPPATDSLVVPDRVPREMQMFMGNSPNINTSHGLIKRAWREIESSPHSNAWDQVQQIYDYVQRKVTYMEGPIRNASDALEDGRGDCEDMTGLFVALCRNARIPARMVWIPGHCYPEFYLEGPAGEGAWFPCQAAGTRQFGEMQESRPILQKGDRFKIPEARSQVRYLAQTFTCQVAGKGDPKPRFIMEKISE